MALPEISTALTFSSIIWKFTLYFSWPIIILLGYKSKRWLYGVMIACLIWIPTILYTLSESQYDNVSLAFGIRIFLAILAVILGALSGYVGEKKNKLTDTTSN